MESRIEECSPDGLPVAGIQIDDLKWNIRVQAWEQKSNFGLDLFKETKRGNSRHSA